MGTNSQAASIMAWRYWRNHVGEAMLVGAGLLSMACGSSGSQVSDPPGGNAGSAGRTQIPANGGAAVGIAGASVAGTMGGVKSSDASSVAGGGASGTTNTGQGVGGTGGPSIGDFAGQGGTGAAGATATTGTAGMAGMGSQPLGSAGTMAVGAGGDCNKLSYDAVNRISIFSCPADFCAALKLAITKNASTKGVLDGGAVQAGRCAAPDDNFDAVYYGTGVGSTSCFYRNGSLIGIADFEDSWVYPDGCGIFGGPVVWGDVPTAIRRGTFLSPSKKCGGLTTYGIVRGGLPASGTAGSAGVPASGTAGSAGSGSAPEVGDCFQAANATCAAC